MSDLREQLRKHYEAKAMPAVKVEAILAEGRAAAQGGEKVIALPKRETVIWKIVSTIAALVMLVLAMGWNWPPFQRSGVSYFLFAPRVVEFFRTPPELPKRSQNPEELRSWLLAQGAPPDFQIPPKLRGLKSFGCQVVDIHGRPAYLTCFWTEKKPGIDEGELVHLLVAHRKDFKDAPPSDKPQLHEESGWSFAAWSEGDVIYTMAANAPLDKLRKYVAARVSKEGQFATALGACKAPLLDYLSLSNSLSTAACVRISGRTTASALPPG